MPDEKMFKKLGVWIDRPTEEAIQRWLAVYKPKYDYSAVVRLIIDAGLRTVTENPARIFGLPPATPQELNPPKGPPESWPDTTGGEGLTAQMDKIREERAREAAEERARQEAERKDRTRGGRAPKK